MESKPDQGPTKDESGVVDIDVDELIEHRAAAAAAAAAAMVNVDEFGKRATSSTMEPVSAEVAAAVADTTGLLRRSVEPLDGQAIEIEHDASTEDKVIDDFKSLIVYPITKSGKSKPGANPALHCSSPVAKRSSRGKIQRTSVVANSGNSAVPVAKRSSIGKVQRASVVISSSHSTVPESKMRKRFRESDLNPPWTRQLMHRGEEPTIQVPAISNIEVELQAAEIFTSAPLVRDAHCAVRSEEPMIQATLVGEEEEEDDKARPDLVMAKPMPHPRQRWAIGLLIALLTAVGITSGVVFGRNVTGQSSNPNPTIQAPTTLPSVSPTSAPSLTPSDAPSNLPSVAPSLTPSSFRDDILPDYTQGKLQYTTSPQSLAYEWYLKDSNPLHNDVPLERFVLATIFYALDGDNWANNHNWLDHNISTCEWSTTHEIGNICGFAGPGVRRLTRQKQQQQSIDHHYNHLSLFKNGLKGQLPEEIALMSHLEVLDLHSNAISGTIPTQLGELQVVTIIQFNNNSITGGLPSELGVLGNLRRLSFPFNALTGMIQTEIGGMTSLELLTVSNNQIEGEIPSEIGQLTNLEELYLYNNPCLTGPIPSNIGQITGLKKVFLEQANLTSIMPSEIGLLTNLEVLSLYDNPHLQGTVPTSFGSLSQLTTLYMHGTNLSGEIPLELCKLLDVGSLLDLTVDCGKVTCNCAMACSCFSSTMAPSNGSAPNGSPATNISNQTNHSHAADEEVPTSTIAVNVSNTHGTEHPTLYPTAKPSSNSNLDTPEEPILLLSIWEGEDISYYTEPPRYGTFPPTNVSSGYHGDVGNSTEHPSEQSYPPTHPSTITDMEELHSLHQGDATEAPTGHHYIWEIQSYLNPPESESNTQGMEAITASAQFWNAKGSCSINVMGGLAEAKTTLFSFLEFAFADGSDQRSPTETDIASLARVMVRYFGNLFTKTHGVSFASFCSKEGNDDPDPFLSNVNMAGHLPGEEFPIFIQFPAVVEYSSDTIGVLDSQDLFDVMKQIVVESDDFLDSYLFPEFLQGSSIFLNTTNMRFSSPDVDMVFPPLP